MIDLQVSRKQIDEIDSQIVKLFEERMKVANEVAKYKMETGKAVFDKEREEQKLDSLSKISHGKFNERAVRELFSQIMSISRKYQYGVLPHTDDITDFEKTEKAFDKEQAKVIGGNPAKVIGSVEELKEKGLLKPNHNIAKTSHDLS